MPDPLADALEDHATAGAAGAERRERPPRTDEGVRGRNVTPDWTLLGRTVVARRLELGLTSRRTFAVHAELSPRLLADLETGKRSSYDRSTFAKLERALRWHPGSVRAVLDGKDPALVHAGSGLTAPGAVNRNIAANLKRLRQARGWTPADLAAACERNGHAHLDLPSLTAIERGPGAEDDRPGGRAVTAAELFFFADLFGVPAEAIAIRRPCETCRDEPPDGFTCNTCGNGSERAEKG